MPYFNYQESRMHFRSQGTGRLLIILPGNTASSIWHEDEMAFFSRHFRVAALDFLGTGRSDRISEWPEDWFYKGACQAKALLDFLEEESCMVMGTSGGALSALLMAIHSPEHVSAVVADSCVEIFSPQNLCREVAERKKYPQELVDFWRIAHGDDWKTIIEADNNLLINMAQAGGDCFGGQLKRIKCPALLTASLEDSLLAPDVGAQICRMGEQIAQSKIYLSHSGDHPFMWTNPDEFRDIADLFLTSAFA